MAVTTTRVMSTEEITSNLLTTTTDVTDTPAVTAKGMDLYYLHNNNTLSRRRRPTTSYDTLVDTPFQLIRDFFHVNQGVLPLVL